jgi:hypothetical protein
MEEWGEIERQAARTALRAYGWERLVLTIAHEIAVREVRSRLNLLERAVDMLEYWRDRARAMRDELVRWCDIADEGARRLGRLA